ncbi:CYFA0S01e12376g1_1 [Cyberlindnera fabianii]|uniref:CYFA0S01e12376g1_1 n=1 Tax=Cyberlindnera fabianii TaxID=36022 RepID=A0A061AKA6_CYBFA|nr:Nitrosoguanidine resistance protein SNG1 [Cyberlindnera fabianii]CDR37570.1 CYFA0S01e12376g1_1 [Cyberlindnera fabianii]
MSDPKESTQGTSNDPEEFTEDELRRAETRVFLPDDDLADQMYGLNSVARKMTEEEEERANDEESNPGSSSDDTGDADSKSKSTAQPSTEGVSGPIAGEKVGFLNPAVSSLRKEVTIGFLKVWVLLAMLVIVTFSIYWGSLYERTEHLHKLKMLVVIQDDAGVDGVSSMIGDHIELLLNTTFHSSGDWKIIRGTDEINDFFGEGKNVTEEILREVHHRHYWSGTQVYTNATANYYDFLVGDTDTAGPAVQYIYETGRDPVSMTPYVVTTLKNITSTFEQQLWGNLSQEMISNLSDDEKLTLIQSHAITTPPEFVYTDYRPFNNYTLIAPTQVGLIYLIIMSFFLFNFFAQIHLILLPHIKIQHYLIYRILGNHFSYLIISLFICAVSAIFQVDFTPAFGRGGFVVFWLTTYLTMAAVGGANENMGMLLFAYNPPFLGFWLISFVILNVSPSFSPLALVSDFYRYGYIFPIHHSNEIYKVIFFDLWKGQLGMNYGVIVAWVVINTLLMPFVLKHVGGVMARKARKEAAAAAKKGEEGKK